MNIQRNGKGHKHETKVILKVLLDNVLQWERSPLNFCDIFNSNLSIRTVVHPKWFNCIFQLPYKLIINLNLVFSWWFWWLGKIVNQLNGKDERFLCHLGYIGRNLEDFISFVCLCMERTPRIFSRDFRGICG